MTNYLDTRKSGQKFTDEEFLAIPRCTSGSIIDLWDAACFITDQQRERLTGDDYSRMVEIDEEIRIMTLDEMEYAGRYGL
jgi:hypothetical protein